MNMFSIWCVNAVQRKVTVPCAPSQGRGRKLARHAEALLLSRRLEIHSLSPSVARAVAGGAVVQEQEQRADGPVLLRDSPGPPTPQLWGRLWLR